mmetsp:Transcript_20807/g.24082  ORF Transcript_20807/g.24082 Transcript_20807/m.24082 type:complete len:149 (+) Transcript_20807:121-567(+)
MSKRLSKELTALQKSPIPDVAIDIPSETDIHQWLITMSGPKSSPYHKGKFKITFIFPPEYPFKPPTIKFQTKIYHPSVDAATGEICSAILYDDWGPTRNVKHCIEMLVNLLANPSADNPLQEEIAAMFREKPDEFEKTAKKWTKDYAK